VFDCGLTLVEDDPIADENLPFYAPNLWPEKPEGFAEILQDYYLQSTDFALYLLCAIVDSVGEDESFFRDKFTRRMALLRGNFYPEQPAWVTDKGFGIATHTDYGCLTLLATDG
jgi:isopenicillin N synthase-like dioxygenase